MFLAVLSNRSTFFWPRSFSKSVVVQNRGSHSQMLKPLSLYEWKAKLGQVGSFSPSWSVLRRTGRGHFTFSTALKNPKPGQKQTRMDQRATTMKVFAPSQYADIPFTDLLTWTFGNTTGYDLNKPLFIDTQCHDRTISHNEAKTIVRKLIGGLKANGLKPDDSVCLHSTNNVGNSHLRHPLLEPATPTILSL